MQNLKLGRFFHLDNVNISEKVNNSLLIQPGKDASFLRVSLERGAYEIEHINKAIVNELVKLGVKSPEKCFELDADISTFKSIISLTSGWKVSFNTEFSIAPLLGFSVTDVLSTPGLHKSKNIVQIQRFSSLLFLTNVSEPSLLNDRYTPYLYIHSLNTPPGFNICTSVEKVVYKRLTTNILSHIKIWLQSEKGELVDFNGEQLTVELNLLRRRRNSKHFGDKGFV